MRTNIPKIVNPNPMRLATRSGRKEPLGRRGARILLLVCCAVELVLPLGLSWQVREILGTVPVIVLLGAAAVVAVPLLAATHALARAERAG